MTLGLRWLGIFTVVVCILGMSHGVVAVPAELDESADEAVQPDTDPAAPAEADEDQELPPKDARDPLYWDLRLRIDLGASDSAKQVEAFIPLSDARQTILRRSHFHVPLQYQERLVGDNLQGRWWMPTASARQDAIITDYSIEIHGVGKPLPVTPEEQRTPAYLDSEPQIAVQDVLIQRQATQLAPPRGAPLEVVQALYDYVHTAVRRGHSPEAVSATEVLGQRRGDAAGKARLLVALLRARGIPARMVGGLVLRDLKRRKQYTYWVEAALPGPLYDSHENLQAQRSGDLEWIELDPTRGHFGRVPNRYLVLFRGDHPLIRHTARVDFEHEFLVMQTTREAVTSAYVEEFESADGAVISGNAKSMTSPVASMVWISDRTLPSSLTEKFTAIASNEQVKVSFLSAPYESKLFRGEFIEDVIKSNDRLIRQADVLVVQTRDDAGLYALMGQGGRRGVFKNKVLYMTGDAYRGVARFFGAAVFTMFHPKGLYIFPQSTDPNDFWDLVNENFLNGMPMAEVAAKWRFPVLDINQGTIAELSGWRRFLMHTWVAASEAGVPPQGVALVLVLPIIALVIVIYRGVLGIETFGTFTPAIVAVAFLRTGLFWGVFLFLTILGVGIVLRSLLSRVHLFFTARMALLISMVSLVMVMASVIGILFGIGPLVNISVFPMVIMAGVIENFTRTQMEVGFRESLRISLSTLSICVVGYAVVDWFDLQTLMLVFPELLLLIMASTVGLGLWKGLRLTEVIKYYRIGKTA